MGGYTLPTASTPGYTSYPGVIYGPDVACDCLAQWLPYFIRLCELKGYGTPAVWQLTGANSNSGGTHSQGGVFDVGGLGDDRARLAREMGATATWPRNWTNNHHTHGVLNGCPHNSPARYQISAQKAGYDGLGSDGRSGPDPLKGSPKTYRTWSQGIAWAKPIIDELEDPLSALSDQKQLDMYYRIMGGIPDGKASGRNNADGSNTRVLDTADGSYILGKIKDGDEATAAAVSAQLGKLGSDLAAKFADVVARIDSVQSSLTALKAEVDALPKA